MFSFSKRGSLTENNGTITNVQLLMVMEKFNFLQIVGACAEQKISNLLRFGNGFDIRNLHHLVSEKVSHNISQILKVTEIQRIRSNQLMTKNR